MEIGNSYKPELCFLPESCTPLNQYLYYVEKETDAEGDKVICQ
jgi:hypothetical protein